MKRLLTLLALLGAMTSVRALDASAAPIEVGEDRPVLAAGVSHPLVEPHLAVNPADGNHLLAASIVLTKPDISETDCASFVSFDGGRNWKRRDLGLKDCADTWVVLRRDGTAFLSVLGRDALLVYRSPDGGRSWAEPVSLGGGHDHETLVVDASGGARDGSLYVLSGHSFAEPATGKPRSSVFVARSDDGGKTFREPTHVFPSNLDTNAMTPVVLSDGTLVVSFTDYQRPSPDGPVWLEPGRCWALASKDGGQTFSVPMMISDVCGRGFPSLAADPSSGPFRDRLYWVCNTQLFKDIEFHTSADRGETWSKPSRVNGGSGRSPYVRTPSIAVNKDGVIGISWYDGRNEKLKFKDIYQCVDLYFAASLDGGKTFLPEAKVTSAIGCADTPENGLARARWPAGGDYSGLAARPDGSFQLLWADSRDRMYGLRTAVVTVTGKPGAAAASPAETRP